MRFDSACNAVEQRDVLRIGGAFPGESGDLLLLRSQVVAHLVAALARLLARGDELAAGPLGERLHADGGEHVVGLAQLLARVDASALAAQPLPVEEVRS